MRTLSTHRNTRHGDTIIEVIIAITIFCLVAIISINLMTSGINTAEGSLELTMARNEIDAQAEALRFIQNSFLAERELRTDQQQYTQLWRRITGSELDCDPAADRPCGLAIEPGKLGAFALTTCEEAYSQDSTDDIFSDHAFILNTRLIAPSESSENPSENLNTYFDGTGITASYNRLLEDIVVPAKPGAGTTFVEAPLYPRLVFSYSGYNRNQNSNDLNEDESLGDESGGTGLSSRLYRTIARAEGIWVIAVRGESDQQAGPNSQPEFFDFYIRTCWYAPGRDYPSTIGTIVRLYNPEVIE